jgi:hypothetical protein
MIAKNNVHTDKVRPAQCEIPLINHLGYSGYQTHNFSPAAIARPQVQCENMLEHRTTIGTVIVCAHLAIAKIRIHRIFRGMVIKPWLFAQQASHQDI